jgi:branched-chain amino acid transport system substrate-binding protein
MRRLTVIASILAVLLVFTACGQKPAPQEPAANTQQPAASDAATGDEKLAEKQTIKIAVNTCFTGVAARGAELQYNGFMVALNQIVDSGYSKYYDFEVSKGDDENDATTAVSVANKSVHQDGVHVVYGHLNAVQTLAALPVYEEAKIPLLTPSVSLAIVQSGFQYVYQVCPNDIVTCRTLAKYLVEERGFDNIAILYSNNEQGYSARDAIAAVLKEYNMDFGCEEQYGVTDIDFAGQLLRIKEKKCDAVIVWGGDPAGHSNIAGQVRQLFDYDILICGDSQFTTASFLETTSDDIKEGVECMVAWSPSFTDEASKRFVAEFKAMDSQGAAPGDMSARGYDSMYLLATALNNLGPYDVNADDFTEKLNEQLKLASYEGLQGTVKADENGACLSSCYVARISGNNLEVVYGD